MKTRKVKKEAERYHQSFDYPDSESFQKDFNYGQARINFELNEVDKDFYKTLRTIVDVLNKIKGLHHELRAIDLNELNDALTNAETRIKLVADIRPPGCEGPYPA